MYNNHDVLLPIFNTLMNDKTFIDFGYNKIIIITAICDDLIFNFHTNLLINNDTSFKYYYLKVKNIINVNYDVFKVDPIPIFKILVWNIDSLNN
jgi:hypothetical protein